MQLIGCFLPERPITQQRIIDETLFDAFQVLDSPRGWIIPQTGGFRYRRGISL
jgi:hypothetical protein